MYHKDMEEVPHPVHPTIGTALIVIDLIDMIALVHSQSLVIIYGLVSKKCSEFSLNDFNNILVFASEWDDHMFAHMLEDQDDAELMSLATGQSLSVSNGMLSQQYHCHHQQQQQQQDSMNDNLLAQLTQQEMDSALETDMQLHEDWLLAHDLEKQQQGLKEEEEFKKLQVELLN